MREQRGTRVRTVVVAALWLGAVCGGWTVVMGLTGWYRSPTLNNLMILTIPLQLIALGVGLRKTARDGRRFGGQIAAGVLMTLMGAIVMVACSFVTTRVVIPTYFDDQKVLHRASLVQQGKSDAEIAAALAAHPNPGVMDYASGEFIMRLVVGGVGSIAIGAFVRARSGQPMPAADRASG
jgi:hypothetical protein